MTGCWVESYPDDVKAIKAAGHDLGNHSEHHKHMPQLSNSSICDELNSVTEKVEKLTNTKMCLFRPPYGDYNNALIEQAKNCGYYTIQWDVDSLDWKNYGVEPIVNTVLNHKSLRNGSIILKMCIRDSYYPVLTIHTQSSCNDLNYVIIPYTYHLPD